MSILSFFSVDENKVFDGRIKCFCGAEFNTFRGKPIPVSPKVITKEQIERKIIETARELNKTTDPYKMGRIDGKLAMLYEQLDYAAPEPLLEYKTASKTS